MKRERKNKMLEAHEIRSKVQTDRRWATRAILALYSFQTDDEKWMRETLKNNNVGFNGIDAEILSSFAEQIRSGRQLSDKQFEVAHRKLGKYSKQLHRIACAREGVV
jgi:hypothetical protein